VCLDLDCALQAAMMNWGGQSAIDVFNSLMSFQAVANQQQGKALGTRSPAPSGTGGETCAAQVVCHCAQSCLRPVISTLFCCACDSWLHPPPLACFTILNGLCLGLSIQLVILWWCPCPHSCRHWLAR
jgi:hypothetical protein